MIHLHQTLALKRLLTLKLFQLLVQVMQIPDPVLPLLSFPVISFIVSVDKT